MNYRGLLGCTGAFIAAAAAFAVPSAHADATADFYKGRSINIVIGFAPGGGVDTYGRLLSRHLGKHVPGNPNVLVQNMPGGGGLKAVNYLYNAAPRDGTYLTVMLPSNAVEPVMGNPGAKFDTFKLVWIGNMAQDATSCIVGANSPIKSFKDVFEKQMTVGATGPASTTAQHAVLMANVLGAKVKVITGYTGTAPIRLAMEKGEVDGMCSFWASLASGAQAQDLKSGKFRVLVQMGMKKNPAFGDAPMVFDFAKTPEDRKVLEFVYGQAEISRPVAAPPGLPSERVEALRTAFLATMNDPALKAEATRSKLVTDAVSGKETEDAFKQLLSAPREVIERAQKAIRR